MNLSEQHTWRVRWRLALKALMKLRRDSSHPAGEDRRMLAEMKRAQRKLKESKTGQQL